MADFLDEPYGFELVGMLLFLGVLVLGSVVLFGGIGLVLGALFGWVVGPALRRMASQIHPAPDSPPAAAEEGTPH